MLRAGYAVTGAAYRPQAWRGRSRVREAGMQSYADRHALRGFTISIMNDDRRHARGGDAVNQAIGFLHPVAGPVASHMDTIIADLDSQMRDGGIEVEQPRHVSLGFGRDAVQGVPGHHELPGAGGLIPLFAGLTGQLDLASCHRAAEQGVYTGLPSGAAVAQPPQAMVHCRNVVRDFLDV